MWSVNHIQFCTYDLVLPLFITSGEVPSVLTQPLRILIPYFVASELSRVVHLLFITRLYISYCGESNDIYSIVLPSATPMIACAPEIVFAMHANFIFFLSQAPSCDSVRISLWTMSAASFISIRWVSSVNITIGRNIEQRSVSKLSSAFFDLCREQIAVSRDNVKASLRTEVLLGSFVKRNVFLRIGSLKVVVGICQEQSHF